MRNQIVFNRSSFNPIAAVTSVADFVEEFNKANKRTYCREGSRVPTKWEPPDTNIIKINIDAGCFDYETTGWGFLGRNHEGAVSFAATKLESIKTNPTLAKALGLRWCLQWAKEQNHPKLIIETDAELIVKCLYGNIKLALIDSVILDCKMLLEQMCNTRIVNVRRESNAAAHALVGLAKSSGSRSWVGNVPNQIMHIICMDSTSS